jgi:tetratricopeptide (TPR) repeat protein
LVGALVRLIAALSIMIAAAPVAAEAETPPGYTTAVDRAFDEFALGNYAEARTHFLTAHRLLPNARTLRALGMVDFEEKRYRAAIDWLDQALASQVRPLTPEQRAHVGGLIAQARDYVARYRFVITPPHAKLLIDGAVSDLREELWLDVGTHELEVRAEGHLTQRRHLLVTGQRDQTVRIDLSAEQAASGANELRTKRRRIAWSSAAALLVAGVATALVVQLTREPKQREPSGDTSLPIPDPPASMRWRFP